MSRINSYKRKNLNDCSSIQLFSLIYGKDVAKQLGILEIPSNNIFYQPVKKERFIIHLSIHYTYLGGSFQFKKNFKLDLFLPCNKINEI